VDELVARRRILTITGRDHLQAIVDITLQLGAKQLRRDAPYFWRDFRGNIQIAIMETGLYGGAEPGESRG
jgi:hypothetical protein